MRELLMRRVLPFFLLLLAAGVSNAAAAALGWARGLAFMVGPTGAAVLLPIVAGLGLAVWLVLTRVKGLSAAASGFAFSGRAAREVVVAALGAALLLSLVALALSAAGLIQLSRAGRSPSVLALVCGLLVFVLDAATQQLVLQGLALATSRDGRRSWASLILASAIFVLPHLREHTTPLYALNVFLFGLCTSLLFFRRQAPSWALPIGFHGGWNFAYVFVMGNPFERQDPQLGLLRWVDRGGLLSGGADGFEYGLLNTALVVLVALAALSRSEQPAQDRA
jgi:membrane protease YdiL (CAAX protease family)